MKVIKITAIWCSGCLKINKIWKKIIADYNFEYEDLDLDIDEDEVEKYQVNDKVPVFIIVDDHNLEISRLTGEKSEKELINFFKENGVL